MTLFLSPEGVTVSGDLCNRIEIREQHHSCDVSHDEGGSILIQISRQDGIKYFSTVTTGPRAAS